MTLYFAKYYVNRDRRTMAKYHVGSLRYLYLNVLVRRRQFVPILYSIKNHNIIFWKILCKPRLEDNGKKIAKLHPHLYAYKMYSNVNHNQRKQWYGIEKCWHIGFSFLCSSEAAESIDDGFMVSAGSFIGFKATVGVEVEPRFFILELWIGGDYIHKSKIIYMNKNI